MYLQYISEALTVEGTSLLELRHHVVMLNFPPSITVTHRAIDLTHISIELSVSTPHLLVTVASFMGSTWILTPLSSCDDAKMHNSCE